MAASEYFSSQNLDLADWPVWRKLIDRVGSQSLRRFASDIARQEGRRPELLRYRNTPRYASVVSVIISPHPND